jgi:hypothetical protein
MLSRAAQPCMIWFLPTAGAGRGSERRSAARSAVLPVLNGSSRPRPPWGPLSALCARAKARRKAGLRWGTKAAAGGRARTVGEGGVGLAGMARPEDGRAAVARGGSERGPELHRVDPYFSS